MKRFALLFAFLPALVVARPLPNAYLDYRVASVTGLIAEVSTDHAVADRYMRHFGMSKQDVVTLFRTLHVDKLKEDKSVLMFGVPENGIIHSHPTVIHKGLNVFADANGEPVLKMDCGNPVVVNIKPDLDGPAKVVGALIAPPPEVIVDTQQPLDEIIAQVQTPDNPLDEASSILAVTSQPLSEPSVIIPPVILGAAGPPGWLFGLPLLLIPIHHGSSPPPPASPEPVSLIVFGAGASALAWSKRKRNRA